MKKCKKALSLLLCLLMLVSLLPGSVLAVESVEAEPEAVIEDTAEASPQETELPAEEAAQENEEPAEEAATEAELPTEAEEAGEGTAEEADESAAAIPDAASAEETLIEDEPATAPEYLDNGDVAINSSNFRDSHFRDYVKGFDTDGNGSLSAAEIAAVTEIQIVGVHLESLKGIEYFTSLEYLDCSANYLTSLDLSQNTALRSLHCSRNILTGLNLTANTALKYLECYDNLLEYLYLLDNPNLISLDCHQTKLQELYLGLCPALIGVDCSNCKLTALEASACTNLANLNCSRNQLTSLDVSNYPKLEKLTCSKNKLTSLDLSQNHNLVGLDCSVNSMSYVDISSTALLLSKNTDGTKKFGQQAGGKIFVLMTTDQRDLYKSLGLDSIDANTGVSAEIGDDFVAINAENFPDAAFRKYISENLDPNKDGWLAYTETDSITEINCNSKGISSLQGIHYFYNLKFLNCYNNNLTDLYVSQLTHLERLYCHKNNLTGLYVSHNKNLVMLYCDDNCLSTLDIKDTKLLSGSSLSTFGNQKNGGTITVRMLPSQADVFNAYYASRADNARVTVQTVESMSITKAYFPDEAFRTYISANLDTDGDGTLSLSEIALVTKIVCSKMEIADLSGIEYFYNLSELSCLGNRLTSLDVSKNTSLTKLNCSKNQLSALDVSKNTLLTSLQCYSNNLKTLDLSKNPRLNSLLCDGNRLSTLDIYRTSVCMNTNLCTVGDQQDGRTICVRMTDAQATIYNDNWASRDDNARVTVQRAVGASINDNLFPDAAFRNYINTNFNSDGDGLLSVEELAAVKRIDCSGLSIADLKGIEYFFNLQTLECQNNQLKKLVLTNNTVLTYLDCSDNQITGLGVWNCPALETLYCYNNSLVDVTLTSNPQLMNLDCHNNNLYSLGLAKNTALTNLRCDENRMTALDITGTSLLGRLFNPLYAGAQKDNGTVTITMTETQKAFYDKNSAESERNVRVTVKTISGLPINALNFPDEAFRKYIKDTFDTNSNYILSDTEIANVKAVSVSGKAITSLKGIEHFYNLTNLQCDNNQLTVLDVSQNTALEWLYCENNKLTSLKLGNNTVLTGLACNNNQLTGLNVSGCTALNYLYCENNKITGLKLNNNKALEMLTCHSNDLASLDLSGNPALKELYCYDNRLTKLDISGTKVLFSNVNSPMGSQQNDITIAVSMTSAQKGIYDANFAGKAMYEHLTALTVSGVSIGSSAFPDSNFRYFVKELYDGNGDYLLTAAEISAVKSMDCSQQGISSLKGIGYFTQLTELNCSKNYLSSLDLSSNTGLKILNCSSNRLTSLDLSKNTKLTALQCSDNCLTGLDISATKVCSSEDSTCLLGNQQNNLTILVTMTPDQKEVYLYCGYADQSGNIRVNAESVSSMLISSILFPDEAFLSYVSSNFDKDGDDILSVEEISNVTAINCSNEGITDLTGIEHFINLTELNCPNNSLASLDVSKNTKLTRLNCYNNKLTSLDLSKNAALNTLFCHGNDMTIVNISGTKIFSGNSLSTFGAQQNEKTISVVMTAAQEQVYTANYTGRIDNTKVSIWFLGDVNADGSVDLEDVSLLYRYRSGSIYAIFSVSARYAAADVNHDGKVTLRDVAALFQLAH